MNASHKPDNLRTSASARSAHMRGPKFEANSPRAQQNRPPGVDGAPSKHDWRELARLVQKEQDPQKMVELVQALIDQFDNDRSRGELKKERDSK